MGLRLKLDYAAAGAMGFVLFLLRFPANILSPTNLEWVYSRPDPSMFHLGWRFFREAPLQIPPGAVPGYLWPAGSSVALTDSIPLVAFLLRPLSSVLPGDFQYLGIWLAVNSVLQCVFAFALARLVTPSRAVAALAAALFFLMPSFLDRYGHVALSSHWIILAALVLLLGNRSLYDARWRWLTLLFLGGLVHPYLTLMALAVFAAHVLRDVLQVEHSTQRALTHVFAPGLGLVVFAWWLSGSFVYGFGNSLGEVGFGYFSMNLNAPFNALDTSTFLKPLPMATSGQYEGYNYLGLGIMLVMGGALALQLATRSFARPTTPQWVLVGLMLLLVALSLSSKVTFNQHTLLSYSLPESLTSPLRSSGRFFWPVGYLILFASLHVLCRGRQVGVATLLLLAIALQVVDVKSIVVSRDDFSDLEYATRFDDPIWRSPALQDVQVIKTFPPYEVSTERWRDFRDISQLALQLGASTTAAYVARKPDLTMHVRAIEQELLVGPVDPTSMYIVRGSSLVDHAEAITSRMDCTVIDGYKVCFPRLAGFQPTTKLQFRRTTLVEFLQAHREGTVILTVRGDHSDALDVAASDSLLAWGSALPDRPPGSSYFAVVRDLQVVQQMGRDNDEIRVAWKVGQTLRGVEQRKELFILSAGEKYGNRAYTWLEGDEQGFNHAGINAIAMTTVDQRWVESAVFAEPGGGVAARLSPWR